MTNTQTDAKTWFDHAFGELPIYERMFEPAERAVRLYEEVVETAQTLGVPLDTLIHNALYTYARPVEPDVDIELGGSYVTLCLLASSLRRDLNTLGAAEVQRAYTITEKARVSAMRKVADGTSLAGGEPRATSPLVIQWAAQTLERWLSEQREAKPGTIYSEAHDTITDLLDTMQESRT